MKTPAGRYPGVGREVEAKPEVETETKSEVKPAEKKKKKSGSKTPGIDITDVVTLAIELKEIVHKDDYEGIIKDVCKLADVKKLGDIKDPEKCELAYLYMQMIKLEEQIYKDFETEDADDIIQKACTIVKVTNIEDLSTTDSLKKVIEYFEKELNA